jgi:hypothetical protein
MRKEERGRKCKINGIFRGRNRRNEGRPEKKRRKKKGRTRGTHLDGTNFVEGHKRQGIHEQAKNNVLVIKKRKPEHQPDLREEQEDGLDVEAGEEAEGGLELIQGHQREEGDQRVGGIRGGFWGGGGGWVGGGRGGGG